MVERCDALVVGAGFGGMAAALHLAEQGARVVLCEALKYPGGCASTFTRRQARFESGATLFAGLGETQLFGQWIRRHKLNVVVDRLDPVIELHTHAWSLRLHPERASVCEQLCAMPDAPVDALQRFFALQQRVADILWPLFDEPKMLPPLSASAWRSHIARMPQYITLLPHLGRPLGALLEDFGLATFAPLRTFLDAMCQITVQCSAAAAETPFALAAIDYYLRGAAHVRGGIGVLARALCEAITTCGADVVLANRVKEVTRVGDAWRVQTRQGEFLARHVVANMMPQNIRHLAKRALPRRLNRTVDALESGWSAAMLYAVVEPHRALKGPCHLQLIDDETLPLMEGNHVFVSASGPEDGERAPDGGRTLTMSTHIPMPKFRAMSDDARATYVADVQARMQRTLQRRAPTWHAAVRSFMPASPRTFERFTQRAEGLVGGAPRTAGLRHYRDLWPRPVWPGLWMVGDSVFPGQSILAAALGGLRAARCVARDVFPRRNE